MINRGLIAVVLLAFTLHTELRGEDPKFEAKIQKVLDDWKSRLNNISSVRYTITGTSESKEPASAKLREMFPLPPGSPVRPLKMIVLLDLVEKRFRIESTTEAQTISEKGAARWVPRMAVSAYNGKANQTATPRGRNELGPTDPDIGIATGDLHQMQVDSTLWPVFYAHGIIPTTDRPLRPDRWPIQHTPDDFAVLGVITHSGRNCLLLRGDLTNDTPPLSDEFVVDPAIQSAILRHTYFSGKKPWLRIDTDYTQTLHGWLPEKWTQTWTSDGQVMRIERVTVQALEANPIVRDEDFTLPIEPGMRVLTHDYPQRGTGLDPTRPASKTYMIDPNGDKHLEGEAVGFTTLEGIQLPPESDGVHWKWWAAGAGLFVLTATLVYWVRRRRLRHLPT